MKKILLALLCASTLTSCTLPFFPSESVTSENTPSVSEPSITEPSVSNPSVSDDIPTISEGTPSTSTPEPDECSLTVICGSGGDVEGNDSGIYDFYSLISLTAIPFEGYVFEGFFVNDILVEKNLTYTFNIEVSTTVFLKFAAEPTGGYYYQNYSHVLMAEDIPDTNGGTTSEINGLKWNYSSHTYKQNNPKGVQIGSSNRPQTSPFKLTTTLPDGVYITSIFVEVAVASGGLSSFTISFGNSSKASNFSKTDIELFEYSGFEMKANSIEFSFRASQKALYVYSFGFSAKIEDDVELNLSTDSITSADPVVPGKKDIPSTNYNSTTKENYYKDINIASTGNTLLKSLRNLISDMTATSYGNAKYMLQYTDENPENPGFVYGMYDGDNILSTWKAGTTWNREHVWPCAKMALEDAIRPNDSTKNHASDLHNLRAACPTVNGYHNDKYYSENNTEDEMYPNVNGNIAGKHEFVGDFRGDVARIMFYMYTRYSGLELTDNIVNASNTSMGKLSCFIEWHTLDPVDDFEIQRNNRIYEYQGNRNPFIDYPELVENLF